MIIGRDLLHELGIDILFSKAEMVWDNATVPMQSINKLTGNWAEEIEHEVMFAPDPLTTDAERIQSIVDAKYSKQDLPSIAKECTLLSEDEQELLLQLLQKFDHLFDGTLGTWNSSPADIELKDPDCQPYHAKPYPVPHSQERKLKAEIQRLVDYGVLRKINQSEWAAPMFTISKPDDTLRSLADLRELNKE